MTELDRTALLTALRSHDRRWDGVFFVAIRTTRIYCRPVCRARTARDANCTFYRTAAAAEQAGYRPCLRCRPELAPGRSLTDATARLANVVYARIREGALNGRSMTEFAAELNVGERQMRRAVSAEFGVSPVALAQTQRLLFAKQLLTDTTLPVTQVAFASGFSSLSRFNALFRARYRMNPTQLRRDAGAAAATGDVTLLLQYRPPYVWNAILAFLQRRLIPNVERCDATSYRRTLRVGEHTGWIHVSHDAERSALRLRMSASLVPVAMQVQARVRRLFDLDADPALIDGVLGADRRLSKLVRATPGLRLPGATDGFELAIRGIAGQQVSVAAAHTICARILDRFGEPFSDAAAGPELERLPITPSQLAGADADEISALGMPRSRARTIVALANAVQDGDVRFDGTQAPHEVHDALRRIPGIGPWTAEYVLMRGLSWPDAFPASDLGVRKALGNVSAAEAERMSQRWRPWRSYAVIHLWTSLGSD